MDRKEKNRKNREYMKKYTIENKEKINKYKNENKEYFKQYNKEYNNNLTKKQIFKRNNNKIIGKHIKDFEEQEKIKYIGCSNEILLDFIEYQFDENMNWDNYASYWHIDHIYPCSKIKNQEDAMKILSWTNIRPLKKEDNNRKKNKIFPELIIKHKEIVDEFLMTLLG